MSTLLEFEKNEHCMLYYDVSCDKEIIQMEMTSRENHLNGRQHQRKMNSIEDDHLDQP